MTKLARDRHVSKSTISRAVRDDIGMKSYSRKRQNLLTKRESEIRRETTPKVLDNPKQHGGDVRVLIDDK